MTHPRAGQPAQPEDLVDVDALVGAYYDRRPDLDDPDQQVAFGTSGHRGSSLRHGLQRGPHPRHHPGHRATTAPRRASTARCSSAATPTACPSRPGRSALEVLAANDVHGARRRPRRLHARRPAVSPRDPRAPTAGSRVRRQRARRRHRRHPVAQPARATAASSTTRRTAARPTPTPPSVIANRANELIARRPEEVRRVPFAAGPRQRRLRTTSWAPTSTTCRTCVDLDAIRDAGVRIGADPLGGASVDYWGEIGERHGLDLTVVNPLVDPQWRFMTLDWDGKIRMDCSLAVRDGLADRDAQGRLRHRHRQRRRRRPARHRHARRRADEPQPLPRRRDPATSTAAPRRLAGDGARSARPWCRRSMIDRVAADLGRHAGRGAGRLQVVRARAARRRRSASAARSPPARRSCASDGIGLDHRQGRHPAGPARLARSWPPPARRPAQHYAELTDRHGDPAYARDRRAGHARAEGQARQALSPDDVTADDAGRRADHRQAHRGARQRRGDRRAQGRPPRTPGSPPARPAPRTSTRSTPSPSRAPTTSPRCRPRPRTSCRRPSADD